MYYNEYLAILFVSITGEISNFSHISKIVLYFSSHMESRMRCGKKFKRTARVNIPHEGFIFSVRIGDPVRLHDSRDQSARRISDTAVLQAPDHSVILFTFTWKKRRHRDSGLPMWDVECRIKVLIWNTLWRCTRPCGERLAFIDERRAQTVLRIFRGVINVARFTQLFQMQLENRAFSKKAWKRDEACEV